MTTPQSPICGNCGKPLSEHFHEDKEYCFDNTTGDTFTEDPSASLLADWIEGWNPTLHASLVAHWKREHGHYCQNPPDRMPGAVSEHQTGSDAPKEPTRFHDGDPCARAAKKCASILAPFNHYADKEAEAASEFESIIRREVAGHYEKEIERLKAIALSCGQRSIEGLKDAYISEMRQNNKKDLPLGFDSWSAYHEHISDPRARLSAAEADSKRLDWLGSHTGSRYWPMMGVDIHESSPSGLRSAIDNAAKI